MSLVEIWRISGVVEIGVGRDYLIGNLQSQTGFTAKRLNATNQALILPRSSIQAAPREPWILWQYKKIQYSSWSGLFFPRDRVSFTISFIDRLGFRRHVMTLFQLVKITLDSLYEEALQEYGDRTDEEITSRFKYLAQSYVELAKQERQPIDYQDPATRFAYVYKYVASHGDYVVKILKIARNKLGMIFKDGKVRVSCIGGGPGSDIIAVLKFLSDFKGKEPVEKIVCYLLDKEQAWADTWTELDDKLEIDHIKLSVNFQALDVTDPDSWASQKSFSMLTYLHLVTSSVRFTPLTTES